MSAARRIGRILRLLATESLPRAAAPEGGSTSERDLRRRVHALLAHAERLANEYGSPPLRVLGEVRGPYPCVRALAAARQRLAALEAGERRAGGVAAPR